MIANSVYSSLYVGAIYSKPWGPEATDSVDLFYSQWLQMQAVAERAHFVSFTLLLHGPGCTGAFVTYMNSSVEDCCAVAIHICVGFLGLGRSSILYNTSGHRESSVFFLMNCSP